MHNFELGAEPVTARSSAKSSSKYPASDLPPVAWSAPSGGEPPAGVSKRARGARAGVGAAHVAELLIPGAVAGRVAYLDDHGSPVVLCSGGATFPTGRTGLRIATAEGGRIALIGRSAGTSFTEEEARRIGSNLVEHRHCLRGLLDGQGAIPIRFEIETVLVSSASGEPGAQTQPSPPEVIPLFDYAEAELELFDEMGVSLAAHLVADHQDLLMTLALRLAGEQELLAVGAREITAGGLVLDVVGESGSRPVPVRFTDLLDHPHQVGTALRGLALRAD